MVEYKMDFNASLNYSGSLEAKVKTVEEYLDEHPLNQEIRAFLRQYIDVRNSLKIINRNRFIPIHAISIVKNPNLRGVDESVGLYVIDKKRDNLIIQDYLMKEGDEYVLFTGFVAGTRTTKHIKHVKELEHRYGADGKNYFNDHHRTIDEVPADIRPHIIKVLNGIER